MDDESIFRYPLECPYCKVGDHATTGQYPFRQLKELLSIHLLTKHAHEYLCDVEHNKLYHTRVEFKRKQAEEREKRGDAIEISRETPKNEHSPSSEEPPSGLYSPTDPPLGQPCKRSLSPVHNSNSNSYTTPCTSRPIVTIPLSKKARLEDEQRKVELTRKGSIISTVVTKREINQGPNSEDSLPSMEMSTPPQAQIRTQDIPFPSAPNPSYTGASYPYSNNTPPPNCSYAQPPAPPYSNPQYGAESYAGPPAILFANSNSYSQSNSTITPLSQFIPSVVPTIPYAGNGPPVYMPPGPFMAPQLDPFNPHAMPFSSPPMGMGYGPGPPQGPSLYPQGGGAHGYFASQAPEPPKLPDYTTEHLVLVCESFKRSGQCQNRFAHCCPHLHPRCPQYDGCDNPMCILEHKRNPCKCTQCASARKRKKEQEEGKGWYTDK